MKYVPKSEIFEAYTFNEFKGQCSFKLMPNDATDLPFTFRGIEGCLYENKAHPEKEKIVLHAPVLSPIGHAIVEKPFYFFPHEVILIKEHDHVRSVEIRTQHAGSFSDSYVPYFDVEMFKALEPANITGALALQEQASSHSAFDLEISKEVVSTIIKENSSQVTLVEFMCACEVVRQDKPLIDAITQYWTTHWCSKSAKQGKPRFNTRRETGHLLLFAQEKGLNDVLGLSLEVMSRFFNDHIGWVRHLQHCPRGSDRCWIEDDKLEELKTFGIIVTGLSKEDKETRPAASVDIGPIIIVEDQEEN